MKLYNRSMKSWLQDNGKETCSPQNKGKTVAGKRFIRTLKNKIYEYRLPCQKMRILIN